MGDGIDKEKKDSEEKEPLVSTRDGDQRCARSGQGGVLVGESPRHRALAEALRRPKPSPEKRALSVSHVDAEFLPQSRRSQAFQDSTRAARRR